MKTKTKTESIPVAISGEEVQAALPKTEVIFLRVSPKEKTAITATAKRLHLTVTEYLVKCHELIAGKLPQ